MTASRKHSSDSREFSLGPYQFYRDYGENLVEVPAGSHLIGYLALDVNRNHFVQVRLLKSSDSEKRVLYKDFWKKQAGKKALAIGPKILAYGEEDTIPYYICSLPEAEPIPRFARRSGPVSPEIAVLLVLNFIRSLKHQSPITLGSYLILPDTLWITSGAREPEIILGDFSPIPDPDAEAKNARLCRDLLKYLSGNPPLTEWFQDLIESIGKGSGNFEHLISLLEGAANTHLAEPFWTEFNKPCPILHQLVSPEEVVPIPTQPISGHQKRFTELLYSPLGKIVGLAAVSLVLGLFALRGLSSLVADQKPITVETESKIQNQVPKLSVSPDVTEKPIAQVIGASPTTVVLPSLPAPVNLPLVAGKATPAAPLSKKIDKPLTAEEILSQIVREASLARDSHQILLALDKEVNYLEIDSKSVDARLRLDGDLNDLQQNINQPLSGDDISILQRAADFNPKANDILVKHYRNTGNWENEIDSLIRYGKSGRPDKLREAGERIFQNPTSTEDRQSQARELFIEAASAGDGGAQFFAGECMILGRGGDKNLLQGASYLRKAVVQGDARAMDLLGVCYVRGWGVNVDETLAIEMFQTAIDLGNIPAYYNLGARYAQGKGVTRDPKKAADIFGEGSEKGNPNCMLAYARCFESGYGRDQDIEKATYWFSKSAEKGNIEAIQWCEQKRIDYLKVVADF